MKKIFLDCGFYDGVIIKQYLDKGIIDKSWEIISFEPKPGFDIQSRLDRLPIPITVHKTAVWTEETEMPFNDLGGENGGFLQGTRKDELRNDLTTVKTIDFSKFVADLPKDAYIICSMDIEGSEYEVLQKMIDENTIDRIKLLDIEFHHRFMGNYTADDSRRLIKELERRGIEIKLKVDLE